jgi:hypothetical protein
MTSAHLLRSFAQSCFSKRSVLYASASALVQGSCKIVMLVYAACMQQFACGVLDATVLKAVLAALCCCTCSVERSAAAGCA